MLIIKGQLISKANSTIQIQIDIQAVCNMPEMAWFWWFLEAVALLCAICILSINDFYTDCWWILRCCHEISLDHTVHSSLLYANSPAQGSVLFWLRLGWGIIRSGKFQTFLKISYKLPICAKQFSFWIWNYSFLLVYLLAYTVASQTKTVGSN